MVKQYLVRMIPGSIIIIIMLHFYRAIFLTSQVGLSQMHTHTHTHTSIRIKKNVIKALLNNKSIGSVIQIKKINIQPKIESTVSEKHITRCRHPWKEMSSKLF